jgi:putative ABC transport system ATP-binding protein
MPEGPQPNGTLISLRDVHKEYRRDQHVIPVLTGISLDVQQGEFLALMGPSGSGKSTLLNLIGGIDRPTRGEVRVAGEDLGTLNPSRLAAWRARHVGFIFQLYNLIPVLTAQQNVELPLLLTRLSGAERAKRTKLALDLVGLTGREKHYPRQLSGGEEQRVAIARAIVADPTLLVADEPTGDLDSKNAEEILVLLQRLNQEMKKTIIMVTHDPRAAERAHLTFHLDKGALRT